MLKRPWLNQNEYFANKKERWGVLSGHSISVDEMRKLLMAFNRSLFLQNTPS